MSSSRGGINKKHSSKTKQHENEEDEVEKLLRATEDDILLKLSIDSHMSRGSSSHSIHPDLDRRFQALRSNSKTASSSKSNPKPPSSTAKLTGDTSDDKLNKASVVSEDDGDDLFARFAALKSTIPSYSKTNEQVEINDDDEGDEVDEVIRWAIDAAALDPSPPSDDDDVGDYSSDDQTDDDDEEDIRKKEKKKKKKKGEQK
ncbi:Transcription initiation factor TFIID [Heracleum sosnowskyi]|uniref:Transcription initiation factor TFIID n=1 Tax=Heracleum sosnowskyi TaxID=360622 RepID=A0AAD8N0B4_9APIA|nr:Transcription initiation factor TFIID [Heracleum sosnowskyi]